jgi:hypothetical protein
MTPEEDVCLLESCGDDNKIDSNCITRVLSFVCLLVVGYYGSNMCFRWWVNSDGAGKCVVLLLGVVILLIELVFLGVVIGGKKGESNT